jgi:glutamate N-acetyltransferase/amino-acid N-acetyltransferase
VRGDGFVVGGMAKGAAMLAPAMVGPTYSATHDTAYDADAKHATMLAVLTTDAIVSPPALQAALVAAVAPSFNALTVDGCTSTNDSVIVLAGGRAGREVGEAEIGEALTQACADLAAQISNDAEGATKVVTIRVTGARNDAEAATAARKVAQSQLVKCSLYGRDPYWGRVVSELGTAGVGFDLDRVTVSYGGVMVCRGGVAIDHDVAALVKVMAERHLTLSADLGLGTGQGAIVTNDLTHAYIDENVGTS